ncbi:TPA: bifunctional glutamate--cysteine ligase GshA/glutathione synthetase GshB [Clostridium perfringens]|uniref:bifunctional glutamate--cysteine ligase GshA/glutathione synthetase GshB n=1 Tax=Clostridium perfringens TaxID=1502 RepID=UPI000E1567D5|nr:bifunctional glutamate--cysteine ligase GshA/glutathione synthetase GshB [Clostridium perfringens]EJT6151382.1 bifunctional glutamate--cysteine ligase GshA/glutathione synthetase GshB [Clostridium perfringens]EJT6157067.1 bifunctional glutamate--cysteine ligase GshA/glutathione synthetase GshB [Clostridium perfringens]UBK54697.1 bifunctional glutamate--cysteine ligase GshA/glutathione synthetase GshB [Clostridium perfringens]UBK57254.1 bifunctional glutamate--cysteine ligase GshA/glutathione
MVNLDNGLLKIIKDESLEDYFIKANFGLEKENVRVTERGNLALTPHPKAFGDRENNPYIKTDFSESQLEMVTPICNTLEEVYSFICNLNKVVSLEIMKNGEFLWPQSNPPILPREEEIPIAKLSNREDELYRENLSYKYGKKKQVISGIHYNFSFKEEFIKLLYKELKVKKDFREFKDDIYLRMARNFQKYHWLLIYLTGASPVFHESYIDEIKEEGEKLGEDSYYIKDDTSLRNSSYGYKNKKDYYVSYNSIEEYASDIKNLVKDKEIQSIKEYYNPIRLKSLGSEDMLESLLNKGIDYLEVRLLDLDPLSVQGVNKETLYLVHLFMIYTLLKENKEITYKDQEEFFKNHDMVSLKGRNEEAVIHENGIPVLLKDKGREILSEMDEIVEILFSNNEKFKNVIKRALEKINNPHDTISEKLIKDIKEEGYINFHMRLAKEYLNNFKNKEFNLVGYEDLELSTQILILDAIKRGIEFNMMDRLENFISLSDGEKVEYVKQATKTSKDSYITALIMENKLVTKDILRENNIRVPKGKDYENIDEAKKDFRLFKDEKIVIKPKSTNFGLGISIFPGEYSREDYDKAVEIAFREDSSILIEEFMTGKEYRFLVIGKEVVGILHREPANVIGNGESTIEELVSEKNKDPLRGKGYKTPLEKIKLGEIEEMFLKNQGLSFKSIPKNGEKIYLRENSNISTGGDSIDFTDKIHPSYKDVALKSAKAVKALICGVDMVIDDIEEEAKEKNHGIIELNFNPAIHIHCFPYKGENRKAGEKILDLLFN